MWDRNLIVLSLLKTLTVAFGLYIVFLGARGYAKRPRPGLLWLTVGIGLITLAAIAEGIAFQVLDNLEEARLIEAVATLVGFAALVYSLHAR